MSITCVENLSNEIFYEIFDYLDGCDIYVAFSTLNNRFEQLLHGSSLLFKIKVDPSSNEILLNYSKQVRLINKHQIFSLTLLSRLYIDEFLSTFIIDSSLDRLESITLYFIEENALILLLNTFICLPRLVALNISLDGAMADLSDVYRLIFALPILNYIKLSSCEWVCLKSLSTATTKQQSSTVKYLVIDHTCTLDQLAIILSYTPELLHLDFQQEPPNEDSNIEMIIPIITLSNLTYLSINVTYLDYDEFIEFIQKISSQLKVFHLTISFDNILYLVSIFWERLILQHFPKLEKFYLKYFETIDDENRSGDYLWPDNQYISSFWIERQWIFQAEIDHDCQIIYSIYPYKKTWYDCDINSMVSVQQKTNCVFSTLTIDDTFLCENLKSLFESIIWVTTGTPIYHLEFCQRQIPIRTFIKILNLLPDLDSLKVWSLLLLTQKCLSWKGIQFIANITKKNKITKVYLENMIKFEEVCTFIDLFPRMKYLQVGWKNDIDIESFVRNILIKIINKSNHELRSFCFCPPMADDEMTKKIQKMIHFNKLAFDYRIKRGLQDESNSWKLNGGMNDRRLGSGVGVIKIQQYDSIIYGSNSTSNIISTSSDDLKNRSLSKLVDL